MEFFTNFRTMAGCGLHRGGLATSKSAAVPGPRSLWADQMAYVDVKPQRRERSMNHAAFADTYNQTLRSFLRSTASLRYNLVSVRKDVLTGQGFIGGVILWIALQERPCLVAADAGSSKQQRLLSSKLWA